MQKFLCSIKNSLTVNHRRTLAAAKKMRDESYWEKIHRAERLVVLAIQRPTFYPHLNQWQQFLISGAPGSGIDVRNMFYSRLPEEARTASEASPDSAFQTLPVGAMALLGEWRARARGLERKCREMSHIYWTSKFEDASSHSILLQPAVPENMQQHDSTNTVSF